MDPILIKITMIGMKKIVCAASVRLTVLNERLLLWKKETTNVYLKSLVLQEQHINHFGRKLLSTPCEVVQDNDKGDDSDWALNLTDGFMIQFDIYVCMREKLHSPLLDDLV